MTIFLHKNFKKGYKKLTNSQKKRFKEKRNIFIEDEFNPVLGNHPLRGKYQGYRSVNVTGNLRAVYKREGELVIFVAIDTHSNLYG